MPAALYYKKWKQDNVQTISKEKTSTDEVKTVQVDTAAAKYEKLISELKDKISQQFDENTALRAENNGLKEKLVSLEHVSCTCEDVESEVSELREKLSALEHNFDLEIEKNRQCDYIIENQKYQLEYLEKHNTDLLEENNALRFFALRYLGGSQ
jgi:regulator of replication initiation timing